MGQNRCRPFSIGDSAGKMQEVFRSKIQRVIVLLTIIFTGVQTNELSRDQLEKNILTEIYVQSKFNSFVRPHQNGSTFDEPVLVNLSMYILHLDVDGKNQEFDMTFYFRQEWKDTRLAYNNQGKLSHIALHDIIGFWTPDLFFANEKSAHLHSVTKPNTFTKIYPDGKVFHSQRLSMKVSCPMNLKLYPFDKQTCRLRVESYGYTADDLFVEWKQEDLLVSGSPEVIGYKATYNFDSSLVTFNNKQYSIAEVEIKLKRHVTNFLVHLYLPITIFVLTSWIPFWLSPKSSFIRITLSLTTIIFSLFQLDMNSFLFVSIGYPTGLDLWIGFSCFLLFSAFFESIYVIYSCQNLESSTKGEDNILIFILAKFSTNMDSTAKILFPGAFALFNISYSLYILSSFTGI